jgi:hypothetical protein
MRPRWLTRSKPYCWLYRISWPPTEDVEVAEYDVEDIRPRAQLADPAQPDPPPAWDDSLMAVVAAVECVINEDMEGLHALIETAEDPHDLLVCALKWISVACYDSGLDHEAMLSCAAYALKQP